MSVEPYVPIACAFHESLEFAVLKRQSLRLVFGDETGEHDLVARPTDVATRDGAEWLTFDDASCRSNEIRLDRIVSAEIARLG